MDAKGYVTKMLDLSHGRVREAIDGVSDAEARRVRAGNFTPIFGHVGHRSRVDGVYVRRAGVESPVPARYTELFKQGSGGEQDYPPLSDVRTVFDETHKALMDRAAGANYEGPIDAPGSAYKTVGEMLLYASFHRGYHTGKIMSLRGLLGKNPLR